MRGSRRKAKVNSEKEKGKWGVESVKEGAETQKGPREANAICMSCCASWVPPGNSRPTTQTGQRKRGWQLEVYAVRWHDF